MDTVALLAPARRRGPAWQCVVTPRHRPHRAGRAGVFAAAGTGLAVAAHRLGGGAAPPVWSVAIAATALFAVALAFAGTQRRLPVISGLVLATQTLMHVGFAVAGLPGRAGAGSAGGSRSLLSMALCHTPSRSLSPHQLAAARATLTGLHLSADSGAQVPGMPPGSLLSPAMAGMLAAHLLAAAALAWWLARGERAVWRCARRVVDTVRAVADGPPRQALPARPVPMPARHTPLTERWRVLCAAGRAPPPTALFSVLPAV